MGNKSNWKGRERKVSEFFGGDGRTPLSGMNSKHTSADILHDTIYAECKQRHRHTAVALWDDTAKKAKKEGKIPVVCLSEKNRAGFWVLCHSSDLMAVANQRELAKREGISNE